MSSCRLVWLVGGALVPDFAPVGGVLASKAPPAQGSYRHHSSTKNDRCAGLGCDVVVTVCTVTIHALQHSICNNDLDSGTGTTTRA